MSGVPLKLSSVKPDFESLVMQLQLYLNARATWGDLLTSSTGETLIEMMAAIGTFNQFAVESASREAFLTTAIRDSSIYAITRMLGVRITRKAPAGADCTLTRGSDPTYPMVIQRFSQFTVNNALYFNRETIMFDAGSTTTTCRLYEGMVKVQTIPADSTSFREVYLNEPGFVVSNDDVDVYIVNPATGESELWLPFDQGIWTAGPADKVYYDSTSGLGDTTLAFGDGYHGFLPAVGNNIVVNYVVTSGSVANNGGSGLDIRLATDPLIQGKTVSSITGGADEKPSSYYRALAPQLYKARTRAVTPVDYKAITTSYPGVASATILAQKDIAPWDLRWMNVVRICILPSNEDAFSQSEWDDFLSWFELKAHAAIKIQTWNPVKIVSNVELVLALKASAIPQEVLPQVEVNVRSLFARSVDTLGKRIAISDIISAAMVPGVDYVDVVVPTNDILTVDSLSYLELGQLKLGTRYSERTLYTDQR